ncbi:hypothetical protein PIB30_001599 [Stylosanthes scabra]|uniref:Uncharacterized protein n=1 Tax=Stylosanthes scabra TaxID=79078 RepID=A0ABU6S3B0_9FABA|nr:hypothetical protein [Stylosanthes scabra]
MASTISLYLLLASSSTLATFFPTSREGSVTRSPTIKLKIVLLPALSSTTTMAANVIIRAGGGAVMSPLRPTGCNEILPPQSQHSERANTLLFKPMKQNAIVLELREIEILRRLHFPHSPSSVFTFAFLIHLYVPQIKMQRSNRLRAGQCACPSVAAPQQVEVVDIDDDLTDFPSNPTPIPLQPQIPLQIQLGSLNLLNL